MSADPVVTSNQNVDYRDKSYGRKAECAAIFKLFSEGKNLSMHGPRRLGKSFVLDRLVELGADNGYEVIKVEIAGCQTADEVYGKICDAIHARQPELVVGWDALVQRVNQVLMPKTNQGATLQQALLNVSWSDAFERTLKKLHDPKNGKRWVILIDELPIFLGSLHQSNQIPAARNFMNSLNAQLAETHSIRWLLTGSIGIDPLATEGNYQGAMAKFTPFWLEPLGNREAKDFLQDLVAKNTLQRSAPFSELEMDTILAELGWNAAFYLEVIAKACSATVPNTPEQAEIWIAEARKVVLKNTAAWCIVGEHVRKHYASTAKNLAFNVLNALSDDPNGATANALLPKLENVETNPAAIKKILLQLADDNILVCDDAEGLQTRFKFHLPLQRKWWARHAPIES
jgi:uncharacterized protein